MSCSWQSATQECSREKLYAASWHCAFSFLTFGTNHRGRWTWQCPLCISALFCLPCGPHLKLRSYASLKPLAIHHIRLSSSCCETCTNGLRIDEEEYGGHQALAGEGLAPALASFVVSCSLLKLVQFPFMSASQACIWRSHGPACQGGMHRESEAKHRICPGSQVILAVSLVRRRGHKAYAFSWHMRHTSAERQMAFALIIF